MTADKKFLFIGMFLLEVSFSFFLFFTIFLIRVNADIDQSVTVTSSVDIGKSSPNILSIDIEKGSVTLLPNSTKTVNCSVEIKDYDTDADIKKVSAEFFDNTASFYGDSDDNNYHYTNNSCYINTSYGSGDGDYLALATCLFDVWYYANSGEWNCTVNVTDYSGYETISSNTTQIQTLLAIGLPSTINYGTVNATFVSDENITNVTNFGNVKINLSLSGYAFEEGDGLAMNCTLGAIKNISIYYEKYNLTASNPGQLSLTEFENLYTNLTSNPVIKEFNLNYRQNDTVNKATNETYWRIYVPTGVAGTCQGNIVFAATQGG